MKKSFAISAVALLIMFSTTESYSQGFLGRLANRAKQAAEKVASKTSNKTGENKNTNDDHIVTTNGVYPADTDPYLEFADGLAAVENPQYLTITENDLPLNAVPVDCKTIAEVMKVIPALPSEEQMVDKDPAFLKAYSVFQASYHAYMEKVSALITGIQISQRNKVNGRGGIGSQNSNMQSDAMQMLALMQKHGINPETATEAQLEEFAKKMILSGELQMSGNRGGAIDMNYSDEQERNIDMIQAKVEAVCEKVNAFVAQSSFLSGYNSGDKVLRPVYNEAQASWKGSEAYNKVYEIEKDIDQRTVKFLDNSQAYKDGGTVDFPPFWEEGRKQENEIIKSFNMPNATKWRNVLQPAVEGYIPLFEELAAVEAELDKVFTNKDDLVYATLRNNVQNNFNQLCMTLGIVLSYAYGLPVVSSVAEKGSTSAFM